METRIKVTLKTGNLTVKANTAGTTEPLTSEISKTAKSMARANGEAEVTLTMGSIAMTRRMGSVTSYGLQETGTRVLTPKTSETGTALCTGQTAQVTKVNGVEVSSTATE